MSRTLVVVVTFALLISAAAVAQQITTNVNVLPVYADPLDPQAHLKGDGYLQRQVEPTLAVSTRNPDHLIAFFNDYRAVDVPDDPGIGTILNVGLKMASIEPLHSVIEGAFGLRLPASLPALQAPVAASEAWVGFSRSYDGGLTWSGGMLPGAPFDETPAGLASPVKGMSAATDPVASAAPCGYVYTVFIAFDRGGESRLAVARFQDLNDSDGGDTWAYDRTWLLESGNNATNGYFLDKPFLAVDVARSPGVDSCGHSVYVSYTTFNGLDKDGKFQSKLNIARSLNGGASWSTSKFNMPYGQNQGTAIAVDPRPGMPTTTGGGTLYLLWRHFFAPHLILMARSDDFGTKFSKPIELTADAPMAPFDQPTIGSYMTADPVRDLVFRSNGFPTVAVGPTGTVFAAWQERVNLDPLSPDFARPDPLGSPRIVAVRSTDRGTTWTGFDPATGAAGPRQAIDLGDRDLPGAPSTPAPGLGALPQHRASGPQVMPRLASGGGQLLLAYTEARGLLDGDRIQPLDVTPQNGFATGYHRLFDFRAALLEPTGGRLLSTAQVSRYPIRTDASLADGETVADVAPLLRPCSPVDGEGLPACSPQLGSNNRPQSSSGRSPFIGDYPDATPTVQFVPTSDGSGWRWATGPADVPAPGFHVVFADNRHLLPPTDPATVDEVYRYQSYGPPGTGGACINPGSRNTDVFVARVDTGLVVSAPATFRQLDALRGYPLSVGNRTGVDRAYRLTIAAGAEFATFDPGGAAFPTWDLHVFPYSTVSRVVYIDPSASEPIRVEIAEVDAPGGELVPGGRSGSVVIGGDPSNTVASGPTATDNPFVENPFVENPFVENPFVENPFVENPFVENPFVENPFVENSTVYDVIDTTWSVSSTPGAPAATYLALVNIDNADAFAGNYAFQLIAYKTSSYGLADSCAAAGIEDEAQVISNVVQNPFVENPFVENPFVENPFVENPFVENPFVENPFVENPFVENSTFTIAPPEVSAKSLGALVAAPRVPDHVKLRLRAFQLVPDEDLGELVYNPDPGNGGDPPSLVVMSLDCDPGAPGTPCFTASAPDLIPTGLDSTPLVADAGGELVVPAWTLVNQGFAPARAENRELRHGLYLSDDESLDLETPGAALAFVVSSQNPLPRDGFESFAELTVTLPSDVAPGEYFLILWADDYREVSEFDETNNTAAIPLTVEAANEPPVAEDLSFSTLENVPLSAAVAASDPDGDVLLFSVVDGPTFGSLTTFDLATGAFVYTPAANWSGIDTFHFIASDGELESAVAAVTITVVDPTPDYGFLGLLDPWREEPLYLVNPGSAVPLKWYYTDPATGEILDTPAAMPEIRVKGPFPCDDNEDGITLEVVHDPGSSGYQYDTRLMLHQFNWETSGLAVGCYNVRIHSLETGQVDGPFRIGLQ